MAYLLATSGMFFSASDERDVFRGDAICNRLIQLINSERLTLGGGKVQRRIGDNIEVIAHLERSLSSASITVLLHTCRAPPYIL